MKYFTEGSYQSAVHVNWTILYANREELYLGTPIFWQPIYFPPPIREPGSTLAPKFIYINIVYMFSFSSC